MESIPGSVAQAFVAQRGDAELVEVLAGASVVVGACEEVSTALLMEQGHVVVAMELQSYFEACRAFLHEPHEEHVLVRSLLHERVQRDTQAGRVELQAEYEALMALPWIREVVEEFLGAEPCDDEVVRLGAGFDAQLRRGEKEGVLTLTIPTNSVLWPLALGGPPVPYELSRELELGAKWAKWRDRRVRRLHTVKVFGIEAWPCVS